MSINRFHRFRHCPKIESLEGRHLLSATINQFPAPGFVPDYDTGTSNVALVNQIVPGPDGNLWFTESLGGKIGRITASGAVTEFPVPTPNAGALGIAAGPDGNLWFTEHAENGDKIGRITPSGAITEFTVPTPNAGALGITAGPDGNLWFTELNGGKIGRITTSGVVTEFVVPTAMAFPQGITAGPDGNLWFTEVNGGKIGRITTSGVVTEFPVATTLAVLQGITKGPDGNVWFTELKGNKIGRITPSGIVTEFPVPTANSDPVDVVFPPVDGIATGLDGNVWFTEPGRRLVGQLVVPAPPRTVSLERFGYHWQPTRLVLTFDRDMDPILTGNPSNYVVIRPGLHRHQTIKIVSAAFDPTTNSVTLLPRQRLNFHMRYRLVVNGSTPSGVTDVTGLALDGAKNGRPGSDYVALIPRPALGRTTTSTTAKHIFGSSRRKF